MVKFGRYTKRRAILGLLESYATDETYHRALEPLATAIAAVGTYLDRLPPDQHPEWRDAIVDDECEAVENLLGAAFVICQTKITAVSVTAVRLREAIEEAGGTFGAFAARKDAVIALGRPAPSLGGLTSAQAVWAVANYFKHRDEWTGTWEKLTGLAGRTATSVMGMGLSLGSTGNLRAAAEALGNPDYDKLSVLSDAVDVWASDVVRICREGHDAAEPGIAEEVD